MRRYTALLALIKDGIRHWREHGTSSTVREAHDKVLRERYCDRFSNRIMNRDTLIDTATSTGELWFGEEEPQFTIRDPPEEHGFDDIDSLTGQYKPDKRYFCEVPNSHLIGPSAVGVWNEQHIILDTASGNLEKFKQRFPDFFPVKICQEISFGELNKQATRSISGPVLPLVPYQKQYYYHWLLEQLPKLRLLEQYTDETENTPRLLIPSNPPSFVTESLDLLGYSKDQLIEWRGGLVAVETLLVTNHRSYSPHRKFYTPSQTDCEWVRNRFVNQMEQSDGDSTSRRTYISRQEAARGRSIINFDDLESWLHRNRFSADIFEKYPFAEQVQMANHSDIIIGPTGAGMSNILFANDPLVVELTLNGWTRPFYFLAEILGHEFRSCICDANDNNDLYVDIDKLKSHIPNNRL